VRDLTSRLKQAPTNQAAWNHWFRGIYPRIYYVMFQKTAGDDGQTQDLVQGAMERFIRSKGLDKVANDKDAVSYLAATATNLMIDSRRAKRTLTDNPPEPSSSLSRDELIDLQKAVGELDEVDQEPVALLLEGHSLQEIAHKLGVSYSAMGTRLFRIREKLKKNASSL